MSETTNRQERSSDEIRRDIERTRAEMDETVDALERRVSPGQLLDQALGAVRGSGGDGAGGFVKDHPVPLALMGLGVAWLAVEKATGSSVSPDEDVGPGTYARAEGREGPYRGDAVDEEGKVDRAKDAASDAASTVKSKARQARDKAGDLVDRARDKLPDGDDAGAAADRTKYAASRARHEAVRRAGQAKRGVLSFMDDQPMAAGAITFGLGLAAGLAAPTTRWEDEAMGETAQTLKEGAKRTAKDAAGSAKAVAKEAAETAAAEAEEQDLAGELKDSAKRVAAEAKDAARQRAEEEDLTPEGMKRRGKEVAEDTKDQAKEDMP